MAVRDPAHYLKPLKTTTTPRRLLWLACQGTVSRKREHYEARFGVAALGETRFQERTGTRKDSMLAFGTPEELWSYAATRCVVGRRVVLFAYDLAEQMRLSQLLTHLPNAGWDIDKIVMEKRAAWCLLRKDKRSLLCCDLRSWCPVEWEKIAGSLRETGDYPRIVNAGPGYATTCAITKAAMTRDATLQILNWIEGEDLGAFRPTGSGQSFSAYRRRFLSNRLLVHDDVQRLTVERTAMHAGRTEAWRVGTLAHGPYVEYDLQAAYCNIGANCTVPTIARGELERPTVTRVERLMERYAVLADITVKTDVECLPYNIGGRTLWPVGWFRTQVWDPELRLAFQYCHDVTVNRVWLYQRDYALRDFCQWVLDGMSPREQVYGSIPKRVLKHWSRCLVGRLGLRYRAWHQFGPQDPPDVRLVTWLDVEDGSRTDILLAGTRAMILGDVTESPESLPQIPGWVMSECRRRLWRAMRWIGHNYLTYVDTDSVIFNPGTHLPTEHHYSAALGEGWTHKGTYPRLTVHGPRNIEVGANRRVSGLPLSAQQTAPMHFEGEVTRSIKESMRDGQLDCVVSMPRTFHLAPVDFRRKHNSDGTTSPFEVTETTM